DEGTEIGREAGERADGREGGNPAVTVPGRAAERYLGGTPYPDRNRGLKWPGRDCHVPDAEVLSLVAEALVGPEALDDLQALVRARPAFLHRNPHRREIGRVVPSDTDAEDHAPTGQHV